jgi:hypothetical protein
MTELLPLSAETGRGFVFKVSNIPIAYSDRRRD